MIYCYVFATSTVIAEGCIIFQKLGVKSTMCKSKQMRSLCPHKDILNIV